VFGFRQREILAERIHGRESLPRMFVRIGDVEQELEKPFHLLEVSEIVEGGQRKIGVAQPAESIVPIPLSARLFREAGSQGGQDGARVFITMEFERERGTNDFFLMQHRNRAMFHPHAPVAGRLVEELVTDLGEIVFDAQAPGERKVRFLGKAKGRSSYK
jgi:hypothetical protein